MYSPSAAPRLTTLVSPVTISTPAASAAAGHVGDDGAQLGHREPLLEDERGRQPGGRAPITARSLTVPWTARWPIDPPGNRSGLTTKESVLNTSRSPVGRSRSGAVGQRGQRLVGEGVHEDGVDQGVRRLAPGTVGQRDDLVGESGAAPAELLDSVEDGGLAASGPAG